MLVGKIHLGFAPCLPGTSSIMILLSVMMVNISVHTQFGSMSAWYPTTVLILLVIMVTVYVRTKFGSMSDWKSNLFEHKFATHFPILAFTPISV